MRKIYALCLLFLLVVLSGCTTYDDQVIEGNLFYAYSKIRNQAYVGEYTWDGTIEGQSFTIPDTIESYPVTSLGGYYGTGYPTPFSVSFPESYGIIGTTTISPYENSSFYSNGFELHTLIFNVTLGIHIKEARNVNFYYYFHEKEDLTKVLYQVFYSFEVNPDNPYIYAVDGKLYSIETDELLEGLEYPEQN